MLLSVGKVQSDDDYIFTSEHTMQPIHSNYANYQMKKIYTSLKSKNIELNKITVHGLRHTYATILINMSIPPTDISKRLGNTLEMVYRVYAHFFEKQDDKTVNAFATGLANAQKS